MTFTKVWWKEIASSTIRNFDIDGQFYLIVLEVENICWHFWVILKPVFESFYFIRKISHENILQITAEVRKITKSAQIELTFIFYINAIRTKTRLWYYKTAKAAKVILLKIIIFLWMSSIKYHRFMVKIEQPDDAFIHFWLSWIKDYTPLPVLTHHLNIFLQRKASATICSWTVCHHVTVLYICIYIYIYICIHIHT